MRFCVIEIIEASGKMDLSIIIVNWNSRDYLKKCIASILENTSNIEFEIIVIDSASFDGCDEMLRQNYPRVRFMQSDSNLGFAKANNEAFKASRRRPDAVPASFRLPVRQVPDFLTATALFRRPVCGRFPQF